MRGGWLLLAVVAGCGSGSLELWAPATIADDGTAVRLSATADGTDTVHFATSAGVLASAEVALTDGVAVTTLRCDVRCDAPVTVTAQWRTRTATRSLTVSHRAPDAGADGGASDAGPPDAGPVDGGASDAGTPDAGPVAVIGQNPWWWLPDGGVEVVPSPGEETPQYDCQGWDGGPHPGYTYPDGGPLALGCDGEVIDFVFIDAISPTAVTVCGTVQLEPPISEPVYPRGMLDGVFSIRGVTQAGAWKLQCLRDPSRLTYRFRIDADASVAIGMGARTSGYGSSRFGFFPGTTSAPITSPDAATWLPFPGPPGSVYRGVDFGVGVGKRPGDP